LRRRSRAHRVTITVHPSDVSRVSEEPAGVGTRARPCGHQRQVGSHLHGVRAIQRDILGVLQGDGQIVVRRNAIDEHFRWSRMPREADPRALSTRQPPSSMSATSSRTRISSGD
jgi:hypothetical protein